MIKKSEIPNDTVTYAKMQNASGNNVILGNIAGAGKPIKELTAAEAAGIVDGELLIDEDDMASDLDTKAPTQQSTKAYVDAQIEAYDPDPDVVLVSTQTASSAASINFTALSTDYTRFVVHFTAVVPSQDTRFLVARTSTNGGSSYDSGASDYAYTYLQGSGSSATAASTTGNTYFGLHGTQTGTGSNEEINGSLTIYKPSATSYTFMRSEYVGINNSGNMMVGSVGGCRQSAADVDAIQFLFSAGDIASGTFTLYAYK